jgi:hypothetical protein
MVEKYRCSLVLLVRNMDLEFMGTIGVEIAGVATKLYGIDAS